MSDTTPPTTTLADVTRYIAAHATEEDITRLHTVIRERTNALRAQAAASITTGVAVKIVDIRPAALKECKGTVKSIDGKHASVELDEASTIDLRFANLKRLRVPDDVKRHTVTGIPLSCLRLI
ncbi:hypothetical protein [Actinacidiphila glaucinigra]|uniref:hypothetical protein n=1 Tax=Actinacidiphila glaucinigra TaxID=235986 RepID=UPI003D8BC16C